MLDQLSFAEILAACQRETERFQQGTASDDRFCLELWRRALDDHAEAAWQGIDAQYRPWLVAHLRRRRPEIDADTLQEVVQRTFAKLWEKSRQGVLTTRGHTLPQILTYVWNAVLQELLTVQRQHREVPLPHAGDERDPVGHDAVSAVAAQIDHRRILTQIRRAVTAEEWHVLVLRHADGLAIPQIAARLGIPDQGVYTILARVLRRLRTQPDLRALRHADTDDAGDDQRPV